jgi:predicted ArsR family transcriptional regulator
MHETDPNILEVSRALGDGTRFAIYRHVASAETPTTVKELVDRFGLHHSAIRIHLHKLQETGLVSCLKLDRDGMVGRPQLAFVPSATAFDISLPPRNYRFLADLALDLAGADEMTPELADRFGVAWGRRYIRERFGADARELPLPGAMEELCVQLGRLGGTTRYLTLNGDGYALEEHNCLFADLALEHHPAVCLLHQAAMKGMLMELSGSEVVFQHSSSLAEGAELCYTGVVPLVG